MSKVIWQGEELPQLPPGRVYGFRLYPGGRNAVVQVELATLDTVQDAMRRKSAVPAE